MQLIRSISIRARAAEGQALVELAAAVPFMFLLLALTVNFGLWMAAWVEVGNAARSAADYAILGLDSAGDPTLATSSTLSSLISADMETVPNHSGSTKVCVLKSDGTTLYGTGCAAGGACGSSACATPSDSEPTVPGGTITDSSVAVDISYTYSSLFSGGTLFGYPLTILPSTIHRRVVMRVL